MIRPLTDVERATLLQQYSEALQQFESAVRVEDCDAAEKAVARAAQIDAEYFRRLPRIGMSCCPFDGKPLHRTFDPYGLDGLWWRSDADPDEPEVCSHFCVLRGAVNSGARELRAGSFQVQPGPEVPYVIPRLLTFPQMVAVIGEIQMANGYTAYPVAYFAEQRPPPQQLTACWARAVHVYTTPLGQRRWTVPNEVWDFELLHSLEMGRLRWCQPRRDNSVLSTDPVERCPYLRVPGRRQPLVVHGQRSWTGVML